MQKTIRKKNQNDGQNAVGKDGIFCKILEIKEYSGFEKEWSNRAGSNCRPPRCQRGALPPELRFDGYHFGRGVNYTD